MTQQCTGVMQRCISLLMRRLRAQWREGKIRRVRLTTRRVNCYETYHKNCCFTRVPLLRQVFLKDICEISVDNYGRADENWLKQLRDFLVLYCFPIVGASLIIAGATDSHGDTDPVGFYAGGAILLIVWFIYLIIHLCRKPIPDITFITRCPQFSSFAIRLADKDDRIYLLEAVTTLQSKNQ
ncbi:hypothetical protein BBJ29_005802 [Phytophthora kernoviae]|uniref:Uncharacterized protein n=1 Tax=Phytophthora kernoviae TaxID=325452 RepID=A0A3F2RQH3_9STRA|nr:hypothetical protein BBP00_00004900 [Phytophthora kernoviae]RLN64041.1 hypothetical protein BBJ29_005802 [Phytophthora kernoviae]